tara:strand:+ start:8368 stop:8529 length:162 start_codon:yes stop_codon:yes gene_type:complete
MIDGIMSYIHKNDAAKHYPKIIQSFYNYPKILLKMYISKYRNKNASADFRTKK